MTAIDLSGGQLRASGVTVKLSNTGKVLFPGDGITKGELIEYYGHVAGWMLPYRRRRHRPPPAGYHRPNVLNPRKATATATATGRRGAVEPAFRIIRHSGPNCP